MLDPDTARPDQIERAQIHVLEALRRRRRGGGGLLIKPTPRDQLELWPETG